MVWVCDGCTAEFDDPETPEAMSHFNEKAIIERGTPCWGLMEENGQAMSDFKLGIHPMERILKQVEATLLDTGLLPELFK